MDWGITTESLLPNPPGIRIDFLIWNCFGSSEQVIQQNTHIFNIQIQVLLKMDGVKLWNYPENPNMHLVTKKIPAKSHFCNALKCQMMRKQSSQVVFFIIKIKSILKCLLVVYKTLTYKEDRSVMALYEGGFKDDCYRKHHLKLSHEEQV